MTEKELDSFVRDALATGKSRTEISEALDAAGWAPDQVKEALGGYADVDFPVPVPRPRRYGSAREAFLYIVYFALLGVVAGYVGALSFGFVELAFEDDLRGRDWRSGASSLRWGIASLVVGFPIFLYLGNRLSAARQRHPERRTSRVRAWLTYVTLIFAAVTLIGDLVAVVYQFLSGEMGARFLAKAVIVGAISGAILWNYTRAAERDDAGADWPGRILAGVTSLIVIALIVWAFTVVRSPQAARANIADDERLQDLRKIVRLVDCHRTYIGEIPDDLAGMAARLEEQRGGRPVAPGCAEDLPDDPRTGAPYAYAPQTNDRYQLCMVFERGWPAANRRRNGPPTSIPVGYGGNRLERAFDLPEGPGEACFDFTAVDFEEDETETQ